MPSSFLLTQDHALTQLPTVQQQKLVDDLEAFLKVQELKLTGVQPETTLKDGARIVEGNAKIFNNINCQAQLYLAPKADWIIACFQPKATWNFGKCFPNMQGMPPAAQTMGNQKAVKPAKNNAGTFLLCNVTMDNPLWVYVWVNTTVDKNTLKTALKGLSFWKGWKEKTKGKLIDGIDDFGKQTSLYLWGNFPQLPDAISKVFSLLNQNFKQTLLKGEVYHPTQGLAEQQKNGQVQSFVPGFPVLRLELPLAKTNNLFDPHVSGELDLVLSSPLYYSPGNTYIGLKGEVEITAGKENIEIDLELDYPLDGDIIKAIGKFKDKKIPFVDPALLPKNMPATKTQSLELDLILQFSKSQNSLKSVEFDLDLENWKLFDNKLTLEDLRFSFLVYEPTGAKIVMASIAAAALLGKKQDIELSCGGNYPAGQLFLAVNTQGHSLQTVLPDMGLSISNTSDIPNLTIQDLRVEYNIRNGQFYAGIDLNGPWKIHWFTLNNFQFHVAGGQGNLGLNLGANMQLGTIPIYLGASYTSSGTGAQKTTAWSFKGRASNIPIGDFIKSVSDDLHTGIQLPDQIKDLYINDLEVSFSKGTNTDFDFKLDLKYPKDGQKLDLSLEIKLSKTAPLATGGVKVQPKAATDSYHVVVAGKMLVDGMEFDLDLDYLSEGNISTGLLIASAKGVNIDLRTLAGSMINDDAVIEFIPPVEISPKYALISRVKDTTPGQVPTAKTLVGLDLDLKVDLKGLPLVGKLLGAADFGVKDLNFLFATANLDEKEVKAINQSNYLPAKLPEQPLQGMSTDPSVGTASAANSQAVVLASGLGFKATIVLGSFDPIQLDMPARPKGAKANQGGTSQSNTGSNTSSNGSTTINGVGGANGNAGAVSNAPATSADNGGGATWLNIQQAVGPIQFNRIGFQYKNKKIWGYLDASLSLGGLTLSLNGLGFGNPINKFDPSFTLLGLGLDFKEGPLEIGGSFLHSKVTEGGTTYDEYAGIATIKMEIFNIMAIGEYANVNGKDSLFLYAVLNYPIGGPTFFFVTGLAAGFGYNRAVRIPAITGVAQFPLVAEVLQVNTLPLPTDDASRRTTLSTELSRLRTAIYPKPGQYFFTAGIRFSSFEMIDSFAMVVVSFGQHFELDVLGLSNLIIPTPEAGQSVTPIAEVQLALRAVFNPSAGVLGIEAQLTNNSFLFSRSCRLTGGFAFYVWFGGPHEGDFVITLGGYHPRFIAPSYYPIVPRLGFNWVLGSYLLLKGEIYFAITARALMAGGQLDALFHLGPIKAWFIIGADFIISWKPYFYDARLFLHFGVSVTIWLFGTRTITLSLGADLHIWGPDFSGKATIHLYIISFTISFGDAAPKPRPIDWSTFHSSFLPAETGKTKICTVSISDGLIKEDKGLTIARAKNVTLIVNTLVPIKSYDLLLTNGPSAKKNDQLYFADKGKQIVMSISDDSLAPNASPTTTFGIAPMDVPEVDKSEMTITIKRDGTELANSDFSFKPVLKRMPRAMWGHKMTAKTNDPKFIENALSGFEVKPAKPAIPGETQTVVKKRLEYTVDRQNNAFDCPTVKSFGNTVRSSAQLSNAQVVSGKRNSLLEALGYDTKSLDLDVPGDLDTLFVKDPMEAEFV